MPSSQAALGSFPLFDSTNVFLISKQRATRKSQYSVAEAEPFTGIEAEHLFASLRQEARNVLWSGEKVTPGGESRLANPGGRRYVQNVLNDAEKQVFERFVDLAGRSAQQLGFSRSLGQIYAALYLSEKPAGLAELMQMLHISKGSASMGVRQLETWGVVRSVWIRGDRRDYYEVNTDLTEVLKHLVGGLIRPRVESTGNQLKDMQETLAACEKAGDSVSPIMRQRLAKIEALRKKVSKLLPLLEAAFR